MHLKIRKEQLLNLKQRKKEEAMHIEDVANYTNRN
jgi:hypothetical protein